MRCAACYSENADAARFCGDCGARLGDAARATHGERRRATIVFADVCGFTALSSRLDPEEVTGLVNRLFDAMVAPVEAYEGTVDKFIGDCVMAVFGAPVRHEDDEARALRAALEMRRAVGALASSIGRPLELSIGVNAGLVGAGRMGGGRRRDWTVMGDAVNVAQRLQSCARPGQILCGAPVAEAVGERFELARMPALTLKGKGEPVACFEVEAERAQRFRRRAVLPLVGRPSTLARLEDAVGALATAGRGGALWISGEPGAGKSRLLDHAVDRARAAGLDVLHSRAEPHLRGAAFHPLRELLLQLTGAQPHDDRASALGRLLALADEQAPRESLELLAPLLPGWDDAAPLPARATLAGALAALLRSRSATSGVLVALEDLHASDGPTLELLAKLPEALAGAAVLLLGVSRERTAAFPSDAIELGPLERPAQRALLCEALEVESVDEALLDEVAARSGGNPFFVQELARVLAAAPEVQRTHGRASLVAPLAARTPRTLLDLVGARVDALDPPSRDLLRHAAVLGTAFSIEELSGVMRRDAEAALPPLVESGLLVVERARRLRFTTPAAREAVYDTLLFADRRRLHGSVAELLERLDLPAAERVPRLAHHYARSDRGREALHWLRLAGERAGTEGDPAAALEACDAAARLDPTASADTSFRRIRLRALLQQGSLDAAGALAEQLAAAPDAPAELRAWALLHAADLAAWRGEPAAALERLLEGRALLPDDGSETSAKLENALGWILAELGRPAEALAHLRRAEAEAQRLGDAVLAASVANHQGLAHMRADALQDAADAFRRALRRAETAHVRSLAFSALSNLGLARLATGAELDALVLFERAISMARAAFDRRGLAVCRHNAALALLRLGRIPEARARALEALSDAESVALSALARRVEVLAACADLAEGDVDADARVLAHAAAFARDGKPDESLEIRISLGIALARAGRRDEARACLEALIDPAADLGWGRSNVLRLALERLSD